jgi:outer membrane receptor protein involved in Fe transport
MDANFAWTRPRYSDGQPQGSHIANAVQRVAQLSLAVRDLGPWAASLGIRYIGAAPLLENNAVRSEPSVTANLRVDRKIAQGLDLVLDVLNLTDRKNNDISYYYMSRVSSEATGVNDVHLHPAQPRTLRSTVRMRF